MLINKVLIEYRIKYSSIFLLISKYELEVKKENIAHSKIIATSSCHNICKPNSTVIRLLRFII